jgi:biotin carboxyl carrier protein
MALVKIEPIAPGVYRVDDGQRRWTVAVAGSPEARWVGVNGLVAVVDTTAGNGPAPQGRRARRPSASAMAAPMPATVVTVLVELGQRVRAGETIVVLEAMKMELPIRAAADGVVTSIRCAKDELVQPGIDLVEIEP